jgi:hypothetical protein
MGLILLAWNVRESSSGKGRTFESSRVREQFACRGRAGRTSTSVGLDQLGDESPKVDIGQIPNESVSVFTLGFPRDGLNRYDALY